MPHPNVATYSLSFRGAPRRGICFWVPYPNGAFFVTLRGDFPAPFPCHPEKRMSFAHEGHPDEEPALSGVEGIYVFRMIRGRAGRVPHPNGAFFATLGWGISCPPSATVILRSECPSLTKDIATKSLP